MKYALLLSILFSNTLFSQSTKNLDITNGYKDLKFNMPFELILKKTKAKKSDNQIFGTTTYDIKNDKYTNFGRFHAEIIIIQDNADGSLLEFFFTMDKHGRKEYLELASYFMGLYGNPTINDQSKSTYKWMGRKVMIALSYSDKVKQCNFNIMNLSKVRKAQQ